MTSMLWTVRKIVTYYAGTPSVNVVGPIEDANPYVPEIGTMMVVTGTEMSLLYLVDDVQVTFLVRPDTRELTEEIWVRLTRTVKPQGSDSSFFTA